MISYSGLLTIGYYVYEICVNNVVRYVGKGVDDRIKVHLMIVKRIIRERTDGKTYRTCKFYNRLTKAFQQDAEICIRIIVNNLLENEALEYEIAKISSYPSNQLWNTFAGGNGFKSQWVKDKWEDECYRKTITQNSVNMWKNENYRENQISIRNSPEHAANMSIILKIALADSTVKKKMSDKKKEQCKSEDGKKKLVDQLQRGRTPESDKKMGDAIRLRWTEPEYREKIRTTKLIRRSEREYVLLIALAVCAWYQSCSR